MSKSEIMMELPKLGQHDRRADERFRTMDTMEASQICQRR